MSGDSLVAVLVSIGQVVRVFLFAVFVTAAVQSHVDAARARKRPRIPGDALAYTTFAFLILLGMLDDIVSGDWQ